MNDVVIKIIWSGHARRIQYNQFTLIGYRQLQQAVEKLYARPLDGNLVYQKTQGGAITSITSDAELAHAIQQAPASANGRRMLRLQVMRTHDATASSSLVETVSQADTTTTATTCNASTSVSCGHSDTSVGEVAYRHLSEKLDDISNKIDQLTLEPNKSTTSKDHFTALLRKLEQTSDDQPLERLRILAEIAAETHKASGSAEGEALVNNITNMMAARAAATTAAAAAAVAPRASSPKPSPSPPPHPTQRRFMCDGCGEVSNKLRFRCRQCDDFDLCKNCYHSPLQRDKHPSHHRFNYVNSELQVIEVEQYKHRAYCDICLKVIYGYRYKCRECSDYDLCDVCFPLAHRNHGPHAFNVIAHPSQAVRRESRDSSITVTLRRVPPSTSNKPVHSSVICDHCDTVIKGVRYKCGNCPDFDLCEVCEASTSKRHTHDHVMIKIDRPLPYRAPTSKPLLPNLYDGKYRFPDRMVRANKSTSTLATLVDEPEATPSPPPPPPVPTIESRSTQTTPPSEETKSVQTIKEEETENTVSTTPQLPLDAKCVNSLSIEDGQVVQPDTVLVKSWLVTNTGTETWPDGTTLLHIGGDFKSEDTSTVTVPSLAAGASTVVSVRVRAPKEGGMKAAYWRLVTKTGERFGDRLWCELEVELPRAMPTPMPPPMSMPVPTSTPVPVVTVPAPMPMPAPVLMSMPIPSVTRTLSPASDPNASPTPVPLVLISDAASESGSEEYASAAEAKFESEPASESESEPAQTTKTSDPSAAAPTTETSSPPAVPETTCIAAETHGCPAALDTTLVVETDHLSVPDVTVPIAPTSVPSSRGSDSCALLYPMIDVHGAATSTASSAMTSRASTELGYFAARSEDETSTVLSSSSHPYFGTDHEDQPAIRPLVYYSPSNFTSEASDYEDSVADSEDTGPSRLFSPMIPSLDAQTTSYMDSDSDDFVSDFSVVGDDNDNDSDFF